METLNPVNSHYFDHPLARLHYYVFGNGPEKMLCFHGYGMHGRQFSVLEPELGDRYTFYGFDLFFHKGTMLRDQSLAAVRQGLSKKMLHDLIADFCAHEQIGRFSMIAYSMGTYYASALAEEMPERIDRYIALAPSFIRPGHLVSFLSSNRLGNSLFRRLMLSENGLFRLLNIIRKLGIIDAKSYHILHQEIATQELRFNFYANASYLRRLKTDLPRFIRSLNEHGVASYFIFGKRDRSYPPAIYKPLEGRIRRSRKIVAEADHDLVNRDLPKILNALE